MSRVITSDEWARRAEIEAAAQLTEDVRNRIEHFPMNHVGGMITSIASIGGMLKIGELKGLRVFDTKYALRCVGYVIIDALAKGREPDKHDLDDALDRVLNALEESFGGAVEIANEMARRAAEESEG